jgi:hypothetical protein
MAWKHSSPAETQRSIRMSKRGVTLTGRTSECTQAEELLSGARDGESAALVIRGAAGAGKSALLDFAAERAAEMTVLQIKGAKPRSIWPSPTCTVCFVRSLTSWNGCRRTAGDTANLGVTPRVIVADNPFLVRASADAMRTNKDVLRTWPWISSTFA